MVDSVVLRLLGERWRVDLSAYSDPVALLGRVRELWTRVVDEAMEGEDVCFRPVPEGEDVPSTLHPRIADRADGSFPYAFSRAITQAVIERRAGSALLLHAAGLASEDGRRGVVLVASSGTGKSTAARHLGQQLGYLSDELMMIDEREELQGLTKPISLIVPDFPGGKDESSPDALGLGPTPIAPPRLAAMVCLSRADEAVEPRFDAISLHELIAEVVPQTSSLWRVDRPLQRLAEAAQRGGGPFRLSYAEIADAEPLVHGLLDADRSPDGVREWSEHRPSEQERWRENEGAGAVFDGDFDDDVVISRAPWTDAIEQDGEVSVLAGASFTRVAGIAATIWLCCAHPRTVAELGDVLAREHGPHPDAVPLIQAALQELSARRLVSAAVAEAAQ
ncbi:MAG: hypothetical protein JSS74_10520 [Actinobacteria bacterium]|nr:hypothetical protein [Actinomycetota bacterium]